MDRTRIERLVTETAEMIDREALEEAILEGICEPVDFDTALETEAFYEGVDVQPGHIAAGLPSPRPDVTGQVVANLQTGASVLVTGPSGVGKSTVMWAAAYSARHVLWYRVRRLRDGDVPALVRLARALRPTERAPVGFIVDAVGVGDSQAWDALQRQLVATPGVMLLGSARLEDLLPLRSLSNCTLIQVGLDEETAAQIHSGLVRTGATKALYWREAFNACGGLTLEFTHLLARGKRLADVLSEQVRRRVVEGRETELRIIALVATAHRWSVVLHLDEVQDAVNASAGEFRAALARLADEHLVHIRGTELRGLHQLRSAALSVAVHAVPPPSLNDTVEDVLKGLEGKQAYSFIVGLLADNSELENALINQLFDSIRREPTPALLATFLEALRFVEFERQASSWSRILEKYQIQPAHRGIATQLALSGAHTMPGLRPDIVAAAQAIEAQPEDSHLRDQLLTLLGGTRVASIVASCDDLQRAASLLAAMVGSTQDLVRWAESPEARQSPLARTLLTAPPPQLGELLSVARRHSPVLARALFELAGGESSVQSRLQAQCPWLIEISTVQRDSNHVAFARLLHISDGAQPDPDDFTREFALTLLRCFPMCDSVDVQTVLPGDTPLQIGDHVFGVSKLHRKSDHPAAVVSWNRVKSYVAAMAAGVTDPTTRAVTSYELLRDLRAYLEDMARAWCISRGQPAEANDLEKRRTALRRRVNGLTLPLDRTELLESIESGTTPSTVGSDHMHTLVHGIVDNMTQRMHARDAHWPSLAAYVGDTLRTTVGRVRQEEKWNLIDRDPPTDLDALDTLLDDLYAVFAEMAWGGLSPVRVVSVSKAGAYTEALHRVAALARGRAEKRFFDGVQNLQSRAQTVGLDVVTYTRALRKPAAVDWPALQAAVGVAITTIPQWETASSSIAGMIEEALPSDARRAPVLIVPLVDGRPVRQLSHVLHNQLFPNPDSFDEWRDSFEDPLSTPLADAILDAHQALQGLSGLAVLSTRRGGDTAMLQKYADDETERYRAAMQRLDELGADVDPVVGVVRDFLASLGLRVQQENDSRPDEMGTLAAGVARGVVRGGSNDMEQLNGVLTVGIEWDIDPAAALALLDRVGDE
ncbi:hypothetical protein [Ornithinimicrobium sp. CNJ-824]|uniref:hypothetical protein n=1 Tax=Ornithinimicrobium sp. CNJ-824 TaxID=1904966 RepID=UPI000AB25DEC|nr:hypothetical protein [Ornithinimicrobium sp. CNJ-824]